jgi:hypothetical protein
LIFDSDPISLFDVGILPFLVRAILKTSLAIGGSEYGFVCWIVINFIDDSKRIVNCRKVVVYLLCYPKKDYGCVNCILRIYMIQPLNAILSSTISTIMDNIILFSVVSALALLIFSSIFAFMTNNTPYVIAQSNPSSSSSDNTTASTSNALNCSTIPAKIGAKSVSIPNPNHDVCDIVILRDSPQIKGHNGTVLNKFLAINSLVELTPMPSNMTGTTPQSASNSKVIAMGEFALLETELKPVLKALARSDWNITAVHNHPILEKPSMIFVHWDALGDLNTILDQTKGALMQTSILQGGMTGGDTTSSSAATSSGEANGTNKTTQQQQGNNQTQKGPLEQLGETIFGGQK